MTYSYMRPDATSYAPTRVDSSPLPPPPTWAAYNTQGYFFDAVVRHPVRVV